MADSSVIINGISRNVPAWASEATLKELNADVAELVTILSAKSKLKSVDTKKAQTGINDFEKTIKSLNERQKESTKNIKNTSNALTKSYSHAKDNIDYVSYAFKRGSIGFNELALAGKGLGAILSKIESFPGAIGSALGIAGFALAEFAEYVKNTSQSVLGLYDNGITFSGGLSELRMAAATAVMPLDEFAKLLTKNSVLLKSFSGGAVQFSNLLAGTQELVKNQKYYGLSLDKVNSYTTDYLEMLRGQGVLTQLSDQQKNQSSAEYIKQLTAYSQILGKSREQINAETQAALKTPVALSALRSLPANVAKAFQNTTSQISGLFGEAAPEFMKTFQEAALTPFGPSSEFSRTLGSISPELNNLFLSMSKAAAQGQDISPQLAQFSQGLKGLSESQKASLAQDIAYNNGLKEGAIEITNLSSAIDGTGNALDKLQGKVTPLDQITGALVDIMNTFQQIKAVFSGVLAQFLENNTTFIADFVKSIQNATEYMLNFIKDLIDPKSRQQMIDNISNSIKPVIDGILNMISDYIHDKLFGNSQSRIEKSVQAPEGFLDKAADILVGGFDSTGAQQAAVSQANGKPTVSVAQGNNKSITTLAKPQNTNSNISVAVPATQNDIDANNNLLMLEKIDNLIDLQKESNIYSEIMTSLAGKSVKNLGDIKNNINNDPNVLQ